MDDILGAIMRPIVRGIASLIMDLVGEAVLERLIKIVKRTFRSLRRRRVPSASEVSLEKP
ncbi:hypothetical protein ABZ883_20815 [Streptomyces sp. NPDC046977]|uniref:hypothetical protein n=1 Tax=Streptomyces sp. NPDC046977 TaxID=3154703 RepID=UPI0033F11310